MSPRLESRSVGFLAHLQPCHRAARAHNGCAERIVCRDRPALSHADWTDAMTSPHSNTASFRPDYVIHIGDDAPEAIAPWSRLLRTLQRAERQERRPETRVKQIERKMGRRVAGFSLSDDGHRLQSVTFVGETKQQLSDTDAEWAAFEARHGKA
jgi:hypothetical protein